MADEALREDPVPLGGRKPPAAGIVVALLFAALIAFVAVRGISSDPEANASSDPPPILRIQRDGLRYTYHVPTGGEALYDLVADPRLLDNLIRERPEDAARLRRALEERIRQDFGSDRLEDLRDDYQQKLPRLRALGYL